MFDLGFHRYQQYARKGEQRRFAGSRVAYNLLDIGENPAPEQVRVFEDISFTMRTSNGTFRTTYRNRFEDVDRQATEAIAENFDSQRVLAVQDRAVSHGLTSAEWAAKLFKAVPGIRFEASDLLLELMELTLDDGSIYITEADGTPLQYIRPPFVVSVYAPEARRTPWLGWVAARAKERFQKLPLPKNWFETREGVGYRVRSVSCIHPEARELMRANPAFQFKVRSVFECTPGACDILRTMNILNLDYFSEARLGEGIQAAYESLRPGGLWIIGRSLEADFSNHATIFRRSEKGWDVVSRTGNGSEMEASILAMRPA